MIQNKTLILALFLLGLVMSCPDNCNDCDESGSVCFACKQDFELSVLGRCVSNIVDKCTVYSPNNQCFVCQPSFELSGNKCVKEYSGCVSKNNFDQSCYECAFGKILVDGVCRGSLNCANNQEYCESCPPGFQLGNGRCVDRSEGCVKFRPEDGICASCKPGYKFIGYRCVKQDIFVPYCYVYYNQTSCERCKNGYSLFQNYCLLPSQIQSILNGSTTMEQMIQRINKQTGGSKRNDDKKNQNYGNIKQNNNQASNQGQKPKQIPNCARQSKQTCLECQLNYIPSQNGSSCIPSDPNCGSYELSSGRCLSCVYGYFLNADSCTKASKLCDGYDLLNGNCLGCIDKLQLRNGKCVDPNCADWGKETCNSCNSGFQLNSLTGFCEFFDPNCALVKENACDSCKTGFYVNTNGQCWKLGLNCLYGNVLVEGQCVQCNEEFDLINGVCKQKPQIVIENCLKLQNNVCQVCNDGFYLKNPTNCPKKSALCAQYSSGGCSNCVRGYSLVNGLCLDQNCNNLVQDKCLECKPNFKVVPPLSLCTYVDPNCQSIVKNQCQLCKTGFAKGGSGLCEKVQEPKLVPNPQSNQNSQNNQNNQNNQSSSQKQVNTVQVSSQKDLNCIRYEGSRCVQCSSRYYFGPQGRCLAVHPSCKDFNSMGQCTSCYQGYAVVNGVCRPQTEADPRCKRRNQGGECLQCYQGYFLNGTKCVSVNPLCAKTNSVTGACLGCYSGYSLLNGNCMVSLRDPYCQTYNSNGSCSKCSSRFYYDSNNQKCTSVNPTCKEYQSDNGQCTACWSGYKLSAGACVQNNQKNSDVNCANVTADGSCSNCFTGFYLKAGKCEKVSPLCNGANQKTGQCLGCYVGYDLVGGQCKIPQTLEQVGDLNCREFTDQSKKVCKRCYSGFYVKNGQCKQFNGLCQTSNQTNGDCTSCYTGYALVDGQCTQPVKGTSLNADPFCIKISGEKCLKCADGYFVSQTGLCKERNTQCKSMNEVTGYCLSCYNGYKLDGNGGCEIDRPVNIPYCSVTGAGGNCLECMENYFLKNNQCKPVSILCGGSYNKLTGQCTGCLAGHFLQGGECIYPALGLDPACEHYTNGYCDKCSKGFYWRNYMCAEINRLCVQFDYERALCTKCYNSVPIGADCVQ